MRLKRRIAFGAIAALAVLILTFVSFTTMVLVGDLSRKMAAGTGSWGGTPPRFLLVAGGFTTGFLFAPLWYGDLKLRLLASWIGPGLIFTLMVWLSALEGPLYPDRVWRFALMAMIFVPIWIVLLLPLDPGLALIWVVATCACWELGRNLRREDDEAARRISAELQEGLP